MHIILPLKERGRKKQEKPDNAQAGLVYFPHNRHNENLGLSIYIVKFVLFHYCLAINCTLRLRKPQG